MKKEVPHDKYFLRSLHQEIDLYDRKLAYLENHIHFASMARREGSLLVFTSHADPGRMIVAALLQGTSRPVSSPVALTLSRSTVLATALLSTRKGWIG